LLNFIEFKVNALSKALLKGVFTH